MSDCPYWKKGQCLAYPAEIEPCKMVSVRCPTRLTLELHAALADLREVAEGLRVGLESCRSYLSDLASSGMVAGHEMQIPSYEVTDALAAHDAWKKAQP